MLLFLLIFLSFAQVGIFGLGGDVSAQAFLEHEVVTLHHWLTPQQFADVMTFSRALPSRTSALTPSRLKLLRISISRRSNRIFAMR